LRDAVADCPAQRRVVGFERVEKRALRDLTHDLELRLATNAREISQMKRGVDALPQTFPVTIRPGHPGEAYAGIRKKEFLSSCCLSLE
jgi:hypothetical protein